MANWRVHLSDLPLPRIDLVPGNPVLIAAWLSPAHVKFFEVENGTFWGDLCLNPPLDGDWQVADWSSFIATLQAPNGAILPWACAADTVILSSLDGRMRLYHDPARGLTLENDGVLHELRQSQGIQGSVVGLDRELGTVWSMGGDGVLQVFQQHFFIGAFTIWDDDPDMVTLLSPDAYDLVTVVEGRRISTVDMSGQRHTEYVSDSLIRAAACTSSGDWTVIAESTGGALRLLNSDLNVIYQQSIDVLVRHTVSVQLFDRRPRLNAPVSAVAVLESGDIFFAIDGSLCAVGPHLLASVPYPRTLF